MLIGIVPVILSVAAIAVTWLSMLDEVSSPQYITSASLSAGRSEVPQALPALWR
jgi:hypothetical protein